MVIRARLAGLLATATLASGCDPYPPHEAAGTTGALAGQPVCGIYPADGFAQIAFEGGYTMEITLPAYEDVWERTPAFLVWEDEAGCAYRLGGSTARVQYGGSIDDGYRPLFVEAVAFGVVDACSLCDPAACRLFGRSEAAQLYVWCASPAEAP